MEKITVTAQRKHRDNLPTGSVFGYLPRVVLAAMLASAAVLALIFSEVVRGWEATISAFAISWVVPGQALSLGQVAYFGLGTANPRGIDITELCSAVIIISPLLLLAALLLLMRRFKIGTVFKALAAGFLIIVLANVIRIVMIAFGWDHFGMAGFDAAHQGYGSAFALLAFAAGMIVFIRLSFGRKHKSQQ
ncbi:exosortase/archaeosortase family protein [Psychromicrobium silvestre]|uniref:Exosortase/archaeosortase family protein n=1 Tax=Psychromicrobium silvestre TaxID=1645614 RepID=A0A7Y9S509_9MICC|nr:exosortase S [Psychromicrobium silvestre]NYE94684.1 exosortase/archaeosortase family protein [Psychromicrobium silvestre]